MPRTSTRWSRNDTRMKSATCPVQECDLPIDIVVKSSDDQFFGIHAVNLEEFSHAVPPIALLGSSSASAADPVCLTETGEVLELLLQCMHNQCQPDLSCPKSMDLIALAEAVEKYMVHPAMEICRSQMSQLAETHPKEVFAYAAKHGYPELLDQTAPLTLTWDAKEAYKELGPRNFAIWVLYREGWLKVQYELRYLKLPVLQHKGGSTVCKQWDRFYSRILDMGLDGMADWNTRVLNMVAELQCGWCYLRALDLKDKVEVLITTHVQLPSELEKDLY